MADESAEIQVVIAADKMTASVVIPQELDRAVYTIDLASAMVRELGVDVTPAVKKKLAALLEQIGTGEEPIEGEIAAATPAIHGKDGYVEWLATPPQSEGGGGVDAVSFYDQSAFIVVEPGEIIGRVHDEDDGQDGRDVTGKAIMAKPGKACKLTTDESILRDATGALIAQEEGVLYREGDKACIRRLIEIPGYVDFSTGNIDFNGDVSVGRGVRDRFIVKAAGNVEVKGLIEAATIITGNDLVARGGFAGRERAHAKINGNLLGKYLDNIAGEVFGDLMIEREVINCDMTIHGQIVSPTASIIGGYTKVTGAVEVANLGSGGGVPTEIVIGAVPKLEPLYAEIDEFVRKFEAKIAELTEQQRMLDLKARACTAADKERKTEIMFELSCVESAISKSRLVAAQLHERIKDQRCVDVKINRSLFAKVVFIYAGRRFKVFDDVKGPVRIVHRKGDILFTKSESDPGQMLASIADVQCAA